ncbi:TadE family type IV pilus minor pilin [Jiangella asiatica]|uniref:Pilus assembly protein TadE n=1 Tax=Jiangella asiatica TaxID=2530372 RepID=A0A4R5C6R0_9ACTN|nr:TadE family type IV pilus minor pilin [Jiangella asiatica]TDD94755.1 pilus assembly protein TadE [Jiangella asiatica]
MSSATHSARGDPQRGMVTAELAAAFPALVVVLLGAVWAVTLAAAQLRCADAAREAARAAARGEEAAIIREVAAEVAPDGADVEVERGDGTVTVRVSARMSMPGPLADTLPAPTVTGQAVALAESG